MKEVIPKNALESKTVKINGSLLAVHTIARWIWPEFEIPQDVMVSFFTLLNLGLRFVTRQPIGR